MKRLIIGICAILLINPTTATHARIGSPCTNSTDCNADWEYCSGATTDDLGVCFHKEPFSMFFKEFLGTWATVLCLFASNCGGLGGGGAMIPVAIFFFNFDTRNSISLSNATIAVAALARLIINWNKNHPLKTDEEGKPSGVLVDYNIATLMLPMIVVGAACGVAVNMLLPEPLIVVLIVLVLGYITVTTILKFLSIKKAESNASPVPAPVEVELPEAHSKTAEI
jgi:uncharacterized membrane protein YfcA